MAQNSATKKSSSLWINQNFLLLWAGQALSLTGDTFFAATITIWMIDRLAHGGFWLPLATAGVGIAQTLPSLLLAPIAGVFVDRWDHRRTMLLTDALRTLFVLFYLGIVLFVDRTSWLLTSSFVILLLCNSGSQFFEPARMAIVTDLITTEQQPQAFGYYQQLRYLALIIGPALAAPLYLALGPTWAFALNALSYLVSFLLLLVIRVPSYVLSGKPAQQSFWREFIDGLHFLVGNRILIMILITGMIFMFAGMAYNGLDYLYGVENLHVAPALLGLYVGCYGIGAVAGMPLTIALVRRIAQVEIFWIFLACNGIVIVILSRITTTLPGMICQLLLGFTNTAISVTIRPLMMQVTPRNMIGRMVAFQGTLIMAASLIGTLIASILASTVWSHFHAVILGQSFGRLDTIFIGIGLLTIGSGVFARLTLYYEVRKLNQSPATRGVVELKPDPQTLETIS